MRLLVVDAETMFAEGLAIFLNAQNDIDVVGITYGVSQAASMADVVTPDIVTTGYRLPDGDGIQLIRQLRGRSSHVKIIMVSSFARRDVVIAAMDAGCSGFVSKSLTLSDVAVAARAVMTGETVIPRSLLGRVMEDLLEGGGGTNLSPTEEAILRLFPDGLSDSAIAERLGLSERSVRNHVQSILPKLASHSKLEALVTAVRRGIILL